MSKFATHGAIRTLTSKYAELKRNLADNPRKISLNDSGNLINDNGKHK